MRAWGSAAAVIAALRDEAAADVERLERDAAAAIETLRSAYAVRPTAPDADTRLAASRRRAADDEADEDWQTIVLAMTDRDAWIADVVRRGRAAIAETADAAEWTGALAEEALAALPAEPCVLTVPAQLVESIEKRRGSLEERFGKRVTIEAGPMAAGCVARTDDGRVTFDNSLDARTDRMQTVWRAILAKMYDAAVAPGHVVERPAAVAERL